MYNIGIVPTFKIENVGTVPMFKMHNVGTLKIYNLCLELEFAFPIQSDINCVDKECTDQKVPFEKLVLWASLFFQFWPSKYNFLIPNSVPNLNLYVCKL